MGSCFSSDVTDYSSPADSTTVKVISDDANLREYTTPVTVSQVLEIETTSSYFLCNSDHLSFDDYIPALNSSDQLQASQIYFVLPISRRQYRLTPTDMAALAVKANTALSQSSKKNDRRHKKIRISPVFGRNNNQRFGNDSGLDGYYEYDEFKSDRSRIGFSRSGSIKKSQRNSFRRSKISIPSFRMTLTTIHEGLIVE